GLGILGNVPNVAGYDPLGFGGRVHVDPSASFPLVTLSFTSDATGLAYAAVPLPNTPQLAGGIFYAQTVWVEKASLGLSCGPSPLDLVSSKGLAVMIIP